MGRGPSRRSGTGWGAIEEARDVSDDPREIRDRLGDHRGGPGRAADSKKVPGWVGEPTARSGTSRETLG